MLKKAARIPWLFYLPFLLYYFYLIKKNKWPSYYGDEVRYVEFAKNLLHGYYSPNAPHINLWNGPGYPIILMPFIALHIPPLYITLINGIYLYLAVVFLYKALHLVSTHTIALTGGLLLALYPNAASMLPILYTEAFTYLLISAFVYTVTLYHIKNKPIYSIISGLILGWLVLTKIIFGYVIIICIVICLIFLLFKKIKNQYQRSLKFLLIAFGVCIPYLVYTFYMTGRMMYWGNSGGMSLYWMSSPYDHEYGDWKLPELSNKQYPALFKSPEAVAMLRKNHKKEIDAILANKDEIQRDDLFKQIAIKNIKQHPFKFISNYVDNVSRMLFNFPYSYSYQDASIVKNIITGSLILWVSLIGIVISWRNWRDMVYPVKFVLLITGIYLLLSAALSAYPRQLDIILPVLLFWLGFLVGKMKKPVLKFNS